MDSSLDHQIFTILSERSHATLERAAMLSDGIGVAEWRNHDDQTCYSEPGSHTLSLYLSGGQGTWRRSQPGHYGAPGRLCLLPGDHASEWVIDGDLHFVHLYFSPTRLAELIVASMDREPRAVQLADLTYLDDAVLAGWCRRIHAIDWTDDAMRLAANELVQQTLLHLVRQHSGWRPGAVRGGLAPALRRRLVDYIDAGLDGEITLAELAGLCALSEFHFARAFRASFGLPPHAWLIARRLDRARRLLRDGDLPLTAVAAACGFASGSHLTRRFRDALGATPSQYRAALRR